MNRHNKVWLYKFLPRGTNVNIHTTLVRFHLHHGDMIYANSSNVSLSQMSQFNIMHYYPRRRAEMDNKN